MEITRGFDLLAQLKEKFDRPDILTAKENGKWRPYSVDECIHTINCMSYGLLQLNFERNDKVAIISNNRPEWNFADFSAQQLDVITVPIYPTISAADLQFILNDAEVKLVYISSVDLYKRLEAVLPNCPTVKHVYCFNKIEGVKHVSELVELGKANPNPEKIAAIKEDVKPTDLLTILYTSGTTGTPKGVMLSHNNFLSNVKASQTFAPFKPHWKAVSVLPLNHVYERMLLHLYLYLGISIVYAESFDTFGDNLKEIKPHVFVTVPRVLEKAFDKIMLTGSQLTGIKKILFDWSIKVGMQYEPYGVNGWLYETKLAIANKLVFVKWREAFGGNVQVAASGGSALQARLARIFNAAQITILEGYGLTETSPVIAVNSLLPGGLKFGTVGKVIDGVEVKIAEDGEILVKGPNVMMGYYKRPDLTAEVMDAEGYFHTGDIGMFVDGVYLKITDRKKEIFKTSGGKYIAPLPIEGKIKECKYVEHCMVVGEYQKLAGAFIVPNQITVKEYAKEHNIKYSNNHELFANEEIRKLYYNHLQEMNKSLANYESIKKFELIDTEWTVDGGELTPKLSLKRKVILTKYQSYFDHMFND